MKIVYIHGAGASGSSFNYIREHLDFENEFILEYNPADGFENNFSQMRRLLDKTDSLFFIAHSMGGIYALHLSHWFQEQTVGAVTISTPFGGAAIADYVKYFLPFSRLLRDIGPSSRPMRLTNKLKVLHPWCNIVTITGDSPWMIEPNDGVVTVASQRHREDMELIELPLNHYEVMMSPATVATIRKKFKEYSDNDFSNRKSSN